MYYILSKRIVLYLRKYYINATYYILFNVLRIVPGFSKSQKNKVARKIRWNRMAFTGFCLRDMPRRAVSL